MGKATTQIETRLTGVDATAAAFASVKRRFAKFDNKSVLNKDLNPFAGFAKTKTAKGVTAGFQDVSGIGKMLGGGASMAAGLATNLAKAAATAGVLAVAIGGIVAKKGLDTIFQMDDLGDAAQKIGLTANEYKRFQRVLDQVGLDGKELAASVFPKMNKALGEKSGQDALAKIGLSFSALQTMSPEERFRAIGAAIANVNNDLVRAQLETDLFGKAGNQLDVMFRQGGKAFSESFGAVGQLAGAVDEGGLAAAGRFAEAWKIAHDRLNSMWQNTVGGMLTTFEAKFGPIDQYMLGMWEDMAAGARIMWLEISTNGPAVFHTFFRNVEKLAKGFFNNWREGFKWVWDSIIQAATALAMGFARLGKNLWKSLKGEKADWSEVGTAFKAALPDVKDLADRLGVELEKTQLVDLTAEKEKIRASAAERKVQDKASLEAADKLQKQTSSNIMDSTLNTARALKEAVKDALSLTTGSYDAFKLRFAASDAAATIGMAPLPQPVMGLSAANGLSSVPQTVTGATGSNGEGGDSTLSLILAELRNLVTLKRESDRDLSFIRDGVESIGVA